MDSYPTDSSSSLEDSSIMPTHVGEANGIAYYDLADGETMDDAMAIHDQLYGPSSATSHFDPNLYNQDQPSPEIGWPNPTTPEGAAAVTDSMIQSQAASSPFSVIPPAGVNQQYGSSAIDGQGMQDASGPLPIQSSSAPAYVGSVPSPMPTYAGPQNTNQYGLPNPTPGPQYDPNTVYSGASGIPNMQFDAPAVDDGSQSLFAPTDLETLPYSPQISETYGPV